MSIRYVAKSAIGQRPQQEDAYSAELIPSEEEELEFYGVYDGHGGDTVSAHCKSNLHTCFATSLLRQQERAADSNDRSLGRSANSTKEYVKAALESSFEQIDQQLWKGKTAMYVGSTAVVAVLSKQHLWLANCGDSRAVLSRGRKEIVSTKDHDPNLPEERARITAAGGVVLCVYGCHRVNGALAMSRAIGDHALHPAVNSCPDVTVIDRTADDDFLVIASDGLWDVCTNQEVIGIAHRSIDRAQKTMDRAASLQIACMVLTKVALEYRGSRDNTTVLLVDMSS
jgi:protein phosphatase 2C